MTKNSLIKKLELEGFKLDKAELAVLGLKSIKDIINNMSEGQANTFVWDIIDNGGLFDTLRNIDILIAPVEYDDVEIKDNQIIVSNDLIDLEADTIFVLDTGYDYQAYETEFDCADEDYLYFNIIDNNDTDTYDDDRTLANIEVELFREDGQDYVYISNDGSSGCKYKYGSREELKKYINNYIDNLFV